MPYTFKEVNADTLADWLATGKEVRLIDIRTPAEIARGVIPRAELLPLYVLPVRAPEMDPAPSLVFYCQSGARSAQACAFMSARGHRSVYNLKGGYQAWVQSGRPVVSPSENLGTPA